MKIYIIALSTLFIFTFAQITHAISPKKFRELEEKKRLEKKFEKQVSPSIEKITTAPKEPSPVAPISTLTPPVSVKQPSLKLRPSGTTTDKPLDKPQEKAREKITAIKNRLKEYKKLTSFNDITLDKQWEQIQELEKNIIALSEDEQKDLLKKIKKLKKEFAKWQMKLSRKAIAQAAHEIDMSITQKLVTTDDIKALTEQLEKIFFNLALRFSFGASITLSSDVDAARKTMTSAEQNLFDHIKKQSKDFEKLQKAIESLHLTLIILFDEAADILPNKFAYALAHKTLNLIDVLEQTYGKNYIKDKKKLLGESGITNERRKLETKWKKQPKPLPKIPSQKKRPLPAIPTKKDVTPPTTLTPPPLPADLLKQEKTLKKEVTAAQKETEEVIKEISRGDITPNELLEAKSLLNKVEDDIEKSDLTGAQKDSLQSTLESGLKKIRTAVMGNDDEEEWEEWEE